MPPLWLIFLLLWGFLLAFDNTRDNHGCGTGLRQMAKERGGHISGSKNNTFSFFPQGPRRGRSEALDLLRSPWEEVQVL